MKNWLINYWRIHVCNRYTTLALFCIVFGISFFSEIENLISWIILVPARQFFTTIATSPIIVGSIVSAVLGWVSAYFVHKK